MICVLNPRINRPRARERDGPVPGHDRASARRRLIARGVSEKMIVVLPSGATPLGGTFYNDSPVLGNWEEYISQELVAFPGPKCAEVCKKSHARIAFALIVAWIVGIWRPGWHMPPLSEWGGHSKRAPPPRRRQLISPIRSSMWPVAHAPSTRIRRDAGY